MHITATFKNTYNWIDKQIEKYKPSEETKKKISIKMKSFFEAIEFYAIAGAIPLVVGAAVCISLICPVAALIAIPLASFIAYYAFCIINDMHATATKGV